MTEKQTNSSPSRSLQELLAGSANFAPHKMAVKADISSGDTILSDQVIADYDEAALRQSHEAWQLFAAEQDPSNVLGRSRQALAHKAIAEHNLLLSEYGQVTGETDNTQAIADLQQELHPYYSDEMYRAALDQKMKTLEGVSIKPDDFDTRTAHALLLDTLEEIRGNGEAAELVQPSEKTLEMIGAWLREQHTEALAFVDTVDKELLEAEDIKYVFDNAIQLSEPLRQAGWRSEIVDTDKNVITVYPIERKIAIPRQRTVSKDTAKKLIEHEVYGHALRAANAAVDGNEVGAVGTARQNSFEESFMIALEQTLEGKYDPARGINHYVSVGMSVTDKLPAGEISRLFNSMNQLKGGQIMPDAVAAAARLTDGQLKRTFAGMTDVDDGVANRSIIDYLHGINDAWKLLNYLSENDAVDEGMRWLMSARFNPYDADDRELVAAYRPMPKALEGYFV